MPQLADISIPVKRKIIRWTDGRRFARRVQVWNSGGERLFRVHDDRAYRLCRVGAAFPTDDSDELERVTAAAAPKGQMVVKRRRRSKRTADIWCIILPPLVVQRKGPPRPSTVYSYMGQRYVTRPCPPEDDSWAGARPWSLKHISPEARELIMQTVRECSGGL